MSRDHFLYLTPSDPSHSTLLLRDPSPNPTVSPGLPFRSPPFLVGTQFDTDRGWDRLLTEKSGASGGGPRVPPPGSLGLPVRYRDGDDVPDRSLKLSLLTSTSFSKAPVSGVLDRIPMTRDYL